MKQRGVVMGENIREEMKDEWNNGWPEKRLMGHL